MDKFAGKRAVITGGVGSGKTSIIEVLRKKQEVWVAEEQALGMISEELQKSGQLLPWTKPLEFWKPVTDKRIAQFNGAPVKNFNCVFDRGIPEPIAFLLIEGITPPKELVEVSHKYRYDVVFWAPPWKEIYQNRPERPQSWQYAEELGLLLKKVYRSLDYEVIEVPKAAISERAQFILENIKN